MTEVPTATGRDDRVERPPHFSYSQYAMWTRCSMQYYFRYVLGLKERPNLKLIRGKAGHAAQEHTLKYKIETGKAAPLDESLDVLRDHYTRQLTEDEPDLLPGDDPNLTQLAANETFRLYHDLVVPETKPVSVETEFWLEIPPMSEDDDAPILPILGFIDLVEESAVTDHKWVADMRGKTQAVVDLSPQLTLYDLWLTTTAQQTQNLVLEYLLPPKIHVVDELPIVREPARIVPMKRSPELVTEPARSNRHKRLTFQLRQVAKEIKAGTYRPVDNPMICSWCGYRDRCQNSLAPRDYDAILLREQPIPASVEEAT